LQEESLESFSSVSSASLIVVNFLSVFYIIGVLRVINSV